MGQKIDKAAKVPPVRADHDSGTCLYCSTSQKDAGCYCFYAIETVWKYSLTGKSPALCGLSKSLCFGTFDNI